MICETIVFADDAISGTRIAVRTCGDILNFNPQLHVIVPDGCFLFDGTFRMASGFIAEDLEKAFQYAVLKLLKKDDPKCFWPIQATG